MVPALEDVESEPFEPFAFELDAEDVGKTEFTSNHMHALVGTPKPESVHRVTTSFDTEFAKISRFNQKHHNLLFVFR
jgi:hypothetical protein